MAIRKKHMVLTGLIALTAITLSMNRIHARHPDTDVNHHPSVITSHQLDGFIQAYSQRGRHRTGSEVAKRDATWLRGILQDNGYKVSVENYAFTRVVAPDAKVILKLLNKRVLLGMPLYNAKPIKRGGTWGRLGAVNSGGSVALFHLYVTLPTNTITQSMIRANHQDFRKLLSSAHNKVVIAITQGASTGLAPIDVNLNEHYNVPVILLSNSHGNLLEMQAKINKKVKIIAPLRYQPAMSSNLMAIRRGSDPQLRPILVLVSRNAWYEAAAGQGTGLAAWLATAVAQSAKHPKRSVIFVALSGNELGHLGYAKFMRQHADLIKQAKVAIYVGGNIAAGSRPHYVVKVTSPSLRNLVSSIFSSAHIQNAFYSHFNSKLGKTVSVISINGMRNPCYHLTCDTWPTNVNIQAEVDFARALNQMVTKVSG